MGNLITMGKGIIKSLFRLGGIEIYRKRNLPFGLSWPLDIKYFHKGRTLAIVLDVGANVGQTALELALQFPNSQIYSFEPVPTTFEKLVRHTKNMPQVQPSMAAMGNEIGQVTMTANLPSGVNTIIADPARLVDVECSFVRVDIDTVDNFCEHKNIDHIGLLKIDTEGHEMNVLRGAEKMLYKHKIDFIVAECDFFRRAGEPHGDFVQILNYLQPFGYEVVSFYTGGVDDLGWVWGDVLFRQVTGSKSGRLSSSPARR